MRFISTVNLAVEIVESSKMLHEVSIIIQQLFKTFQECIILLCQNLNIKGLGYDKNGASLGIEKLITLLTLIYFAKNLSCLDKFFKSFYLIRFNKNRFT